MSASPAPALPDAPQPVVNPYPYDPPDFAGSSVEPPSKKAKLSSEGPAEETNDTSETPDAHEPNETVYIRNLNEDVPLANLKATLANLLSLFGRVVSVQAQKQVRMRGQAFVTMSTPQAAATAVRELQGFMLYGRTMQPSFAQHKSTASIKRRAERQAKRAVAEAQGDAAAIQEAHQAKEADIKQHTDWLKLHQKKQRRGNALRRKQLETRIAEERGDAPQPKSKVVTGFADEYLPPNKVLFLQGLPDTTTQTDIEALLVEVGRVPSGFEVRTVPRNPNIAFVEFGDIATSATAKALLDAHEFSSGDRLKATFAR